jgi:hypothetical protein
MSSPPWEFGPWELRIVEILANIILYFVVDSEDWELDPTRLGNVFLEVISFSKISCFPNTKAHFR